MSNTTRNNKKNANKKSYLKNELGRAKELQIELLAYPDVESVIAEINNYLEIIKMIGKIKVKKRKLFSTKLIKKIAAKLEVIYSSALEVVTRPINQQEWISNGRPLALEEAKCLLAQQLLILDSVTTIYLEEYRDDGGKYQLVFGAFNMLKDVEKALNEMPSIWREEFDFAQTKEVA